MKAILLDAGAAGGILILILGLFFYFLPAIIGKDKDNAGAIFILNLFLGWTLIGWIVALVWACTNDAKPPQTHIINQQQPGTDKFDKLARMKSLLDSGAITAEEYEKEKAKLLS